MGLLRKNKEPDKVQLYHLWKSKILTIKFKEMIELNSAWKSDGDSFLSIDDDVTLDTSKLKENLESRMIKNPSLVQMDSELLMHFQKNSTVTIKNGFFTFERDDLIETGLPEDLFLVKEKEMKHRNWKALGSIAKTGALCTGAFVAGYAIADKVVPDFKVNS